MGSVVAAGASGISTRWSARRWRSRWAESSTSCSAGGRTRSSRPTGRSRRTLATHRPLAKEWNTIRLEGDVAEAVRKLKAQPGPELQVHGSATLIQTLLKNDLVDGLWLKIFPVTIGGGRRLFAEGTAYAGFELVESSASPSGVILAKYRRAGDVKSGSFV